MPTRPKASVTLASLPVSVGGVAVVTGPDRVHVLLDLAHLDVERLRWHMLGIHATQRQAVRSALAALFVPLDGA